MTEVKNKRKLLCFIFGHFTNKKHDFKEIVICDRCNRKIRATYDFLHPGYELVKENQ